MKKRILSLLLVLLLLGTLVGCDLGMPQEEAAIYLPLTPISTSAFDPADVPAYEGTAYIQMHDNTPYFSSENLTCDSYELYGELDALGRCTACVSCIGEDLMPTEPRENISDVRPTGWQSVQYDFIDGLSLYNRCHLIGFQLTAENANERNLITGTRYMNLNMTDYEELVAEYVKTQHRHVLYRVTPVFEGENLIAKGVLMEAMSVEDAGASICFCVFLYNVQPGVVIDYATGNNHLKASDGAVTYILNVAGGKFHLPSCESVDSIKEKNKLRFEGTREDLLAMGYIPCKACHP